MINRIPVEAGDLNALATLAPGVVGVAATDSTTASFSVAGQPTNQNNITLDGLSFGAGSVPQEAIRGTRVITNTYDVARGQFTGGQVATTTRGGTNVSTGALNYSLRDPSLEFAPEEEATFTQKYTQNQISGGFGGPIQGDRIAVQVIAEFTSLLSILCINMVNTLNPAMILLGGKLSQNYPAVAAMLQERIHKDLLAVSAEAFRVRPAHHGEDGVVLGAVGLILYELFEPLHRISVRATKKKSLAGAEEADAL